MSLKKSLTFIFAFVCISNAYGSDNLKQQWQKLRQEQPTLHTRDAAKTLGASEAQLLATQKDQVVLLKSDADSLRKIMRQALDFGEVLALSRNENGIIETTGVAKKYTSPNKDTLSEEDKLRQQNSVGGYIGGPIDLRLNFEKWAHAFAVTQIKNGKTSRSLQFFDAQGDAIHKIFIKNKEGNILFDQLAKNFRLGDQNTTLVFTPKSINAVELPDDQIDIKEFQLTWNEMDDVHQFARIVSDFKLTREQAFRLAPEGFAQKVSASSIRTFLQDAAKERIGIMAFLGNRGIIQIFSGTIQKVAAHEEWFNVLDPNFNLHLRESAISHGWIVNRAGIRSIEFYDKQGELIVTFFAVREPKKPQPQKWFELLEQIKS
jgi:putative hemin transport protein